MRSQAFFFLGPLAWLWAPAGVALAFALGCLLATFYAERKVSAFMQDRLGPMQQGPYGIGQAFADIGKLLQKGRSYVLGADMLLFSAAPLCVFAAVFAGFAVVPVAPGLAPVGVAGAGVFYLLAVVSLDAAGVWMAGWASHSKYPLLGAMRAVGQLLSYEVPLGLTVLAAVCWAGTTDLAEIARLQSPEAARPLWLFGSSGLGVDTRAAGGFLTWNIMQVPWFLPLFFIYWICTLAECNRAPFDLPEGESELVGGYHTEYAGFGFALFFLAEYTLMALVCVVGVFLFLGGGNTPLPNLGSVRLADWTGAAHPGWAIFWLGGKTLMLLFSHVWVRWTLPRLRIDQLMHLGWKVLTPAALMLLLATLAWRVM